MLPVVIYWFPETKNLSLEEIGALFDDEVAIDLSHLSEKERQEFDDRLAATIDPVTGGSAAAKGVGVTQHIDNIECIDETPDSKA